MHRGGASPLGCFVHAGSRSLDGELGYRTRIIDKMHDTTWSAVEQYDCVHLMRAFH